jgi:hypothetical protein
MTGVSCPGECEDERFFILNFLIGLDSPMTGNTAVIAITKHGIDIANRIMERMPEVQVYAPIKIFNP